MFGEVCTVQYIRVFAKVLRIHPRWHCSGQPLLDRSVDARLLEGSPVLVLLIEALDGHFYGKQRPNSRPCSGPAETGAGNELPVVGALCMDVLAFGTSLSEPSGGRSTFHKSHIFFVFCGGETRIALEVASRRI
jgi:hypothetical protein